MFLAVTNAISLGRYIEHMNRRQFVSNVAGTLTVAAIGAGAEPPPPPPDHSAKRVLVMFKCHFDCGFIDTQAAVVRKYFEHYYPEAIRVAAAAKQADSDRYVWTTGSWLLYEYLEQAKAAERRRMEEAIHAGDIAWHALPFSWQTELLDPSAIATCIGFSKSLDRRFGRTTTGAKMTDVPGHSRGLVTPLAQGGVTLLDIGVNSASTPPDVPAAFLWRDPNNRSLIMLYHRRAYGGVIRIPSSDLAIAVEVRDDNSGPHTAQEIRQIYASLRLQFPNASVQAANLTEIANAVEPFRDKLPVVTGEIGDTWIYGVASDPVKVRSLSRVASAAPRMDRRRQAKTGRALRIWHFCAASRSPPSTPGELTQKPGSILITTRRALSRRCLISRIIEWSQGAGPKSETTLMKASLRFPPHCERRRRSGSLR